jgi:uncharacterized protein (TIGR02001 family)
VGAWASTIKWVKDGGGDGNLDLDLYGGYKGELVKDVGFDVGILAYVYPGNSLPTSANTTELYGAVTCGTATLKYSHSLNNLFGCGTTIGRVKICTLQASWVNVSVSNLINNIIQLVNYTF